MKTLARIAASMAALMSAMTLSSCSDNGQVVTARFVSAAPLVVGNQVKIDGITVGKITSMRVRNGMAEVAMNLDPTAMPLHSDATFMIRPASLLGERYVDIDRGTPSAPLLDMSQTVPVSHTKTNVGLDEVLNTMDDPASEGLAMLVTTLGTGVRGNGQNVDETIQQLAPNMKDIRALAAILKNHNELLGALVQDSEPVVGALADKDGQTLDQLVSSSDRLLGATASQQADLERTISDLPGALKSGRKTLKSLSDTADEAAPTLDAMQPFTDHLPKISKELRNFSEALDPALASSRPVLDRAEELVVEAQRPADDLRIAGPDVASTVHGTRTIVHGLTENRDVMFSFIRNWALNTNGFDGLSHYWRVNLTLDDDSWTALLGILGLQAPAALTGASAPGTSAATADSKAPSGINAPELVNGVTRQLTGLTNGLSKTTKQLGDSVNSTVGGATGSLLNGQTTAQGGTTGLSSKQESGLLGFLFGKGQ